MLASPDRVPGDGSLHQLARRAIAEVGDNSLNPIWVNVLPVIVYFVTEVSPPVSAMLSLYVSPVAASGSPLENVLFVTVSLICELLAAMDSTALD